MEKQKKSNKFVTKKDLVLVLGLVIALLLVDLSPIGGNIRFYVKWIGCGQKPVASDVSIHVDASQPRYYHQANMWPEFRGSAQFFCTPLEAERAGFSASSTEYIFPHLDNKTKHE